MREAVISLEMFEGTKEGREAAMAEAEGARLTAAMLETRDISRKAGALERESPLFFGSGDNPGLF